MLRDSIGHREPPPGEVRYEARRRCIEATCFGPAYARLRQNGTRLHGPPGGERCRPTGRGDLRRVGDIEALSRSCAVGSTDAHDGPRPQERPAVQRQLADGIFCPAIRRRRARGRIEPRRAFISPMRRPRVIPSLGSSQRAFVAIPNAVLFLVAVYASIAACKYPQCRAPVI